MSNEILMSKLMTELEFTSMGDHRKFKFIKTHLDSVHATVRFLIEALNYKRWQANKVAYNVRYRKLYYQRQKALRTLIS